MFKARKAFLRPIFIIPLGASLLWMALAWALPARAAPLQVVDENSAIISVTYLALGASDIISDPVRHRLYASLPSAVGVGGNRIVPVEVPTGTLGTPLFVGSEPNHMALSSDGQYLFVGIDGANAVRRVNLISYTADIQIPLGASDSCGGNVAGDIVALQGTPQSIAVSTRGSGCFPDDSRVTIFDNATARPDSTDTSVNNSVIEPSLSPSSLFGYNNTDSSYGLNTLTISPTGIGISTTVFGLVNGFVDILFDDGLLYSTGGAVVDTQSMTLLGTYAGNGPIAPDSSHSIVYMVANGDFDQPYALRIFNQTEFTQIKRLPLYNINGGPKRLLLMDSQHLAMLTDSGDLYLITLGELVPLAPAIASNPPLTAMEEVQYTYDITATDPNYGDNLVISAPVLPSWLQLSAFGSSGSLSGYPSLNNIGENPVELLVTDSQGLTSTQRFTVTVAANPIYIAPIFSSTPPLTVTEGNVYTYNVTADDANEGDYLTFSAPVLPSWLEFYDNFNGTAIVHGTPTHANVGAQTVTIMVTDNHGLTDTQQFTVEVASGPVYAAPTFASTPPLTATEAITYSYLITAIDADLGDLLTFSATVLPSWLHLSQLENGIARLSGLPSSADVGAHGVTLVVSDTHGLTDLQQFTVTVTGSGDDLSPSFGSTPILGAAEGITYTYVVTASAVHSGDLLTISAPVLPSWLHLSQLVNGAAILSGAASKEDIGGNLVVLVVTDTHGLGDTQPFTVTVVGVGEVTGILFDDVNHNGAQEQGEAGIAEATVSLTPSAGSIAALALAQEAITTTTNSSGAYHFLHVPTGSYMVSFDLPGNGANPPSVAVEVTGSVPTVVAPVAAAPKQQLIYLPSMTNRARAASSGENLAAGQGQK